MNPIGFNAGTCERRRCFVCGHYWRLVDLRYFFRGLWSCLDQERCARHKEAK